MNSWAQHLARAENADDAADAENVKNARPDDVAHGDIALLTHRRGDGGAQLRQGRSEGQKGQPDNAFAGVKLLAERDAAINEEAGAERQTDQADQDQHGHAPCRRIHDRDFFLVFVLSSRSIIQASTA